MRFYIVDDDPNIVKILDNVINEKNLGTVVGYSYDGLTAVSEILDSKPDIVLVDYLMPNKDGSSVAKEIRKRNNDIYFVVISQVSDQEMITESYISGAEFFISKPINVIEVEKVIRSLSEKIEMARAICSIKKMLGFTVNSSEIANEDEGNQINNIKYVLSNIGVLGEKGAYDIMEICRYKIEKGVDNILSVDINEICIQLGKEVKTTKQRMRRAIKKGLTNIAYMGIEDYMNEYFVKYSNSIFDFENVKKEMDYLRGKRFSGGKVNVGKFVENLLIQSRDA